MMMLGRLAVLALSEVILIFLSFIRQYCVFLCWLRWTDASEKKTGFKRSFFCVSLCFPCQLHPELTPWLVETRFGSSYCGGKSRTVLIGSGQWCCRIDSVPAPWLGCFGLVKKRHKWNGETTHNDIFLLQTKQALKILQYTILGICNVIWDV